MVVMVIMQYMCAACARTGGGSHAQLGAAPRIVDVGATVRAEPGVELLEALGETFAAGAPLGRCGAAAGASNLSKPAHEPHMRFTWLVCMRLIQQDPRVRPRVGEPQKMRASGS